MERKINLVFTQGEGFPSGTFSYTDIIVQQSPDLADSEVWNSPGLADSVS
jgi:hypothetical protein